MSDSFERDAHHADSIWEEALDFAGVGLLRLDAEGSVSFVTTSAMRVLGLDHQFASAREVLGKPLSAIADGLLPESVIGGDARRRGPIREQRTLFKTASGAQRWIQYDCYYGDESGSGGEFVQVVLQDVTERREREQQANMKQLAVEASATAIALANLDGVFTYANSALAEMWGYDRAAEIVGRHMETFWVDAAEARRVSLILHSDDQWAGELQARRKSGELFDVHLSCTRVLSREEVPQCLIVSCVDLSAMKRIEKEHLARINMERLIVGITTDLVARLSQDLNTSVTRVLHDLADYASVTHGLLVLVDATRQWVDHAYEWHSDESLSVIQKGVGIRISRFTWAAELLASREAVVIPSVDEINANATAERKALRLLKIASAILVPVLHNDQVIGVIGLGADTPHHPWSPQVANLLRISGEILANVAQRRFAENELLRRAEFERIVNAISTQFIGMPPSEIDGEIHNALKAIGQFVATDRCYLSLLSEEKGAMLNSYEWCAEGVSSQLTILENVAVAKAFPWAAERLVQGEPLIVTRLSDLPEAAEGERKLLESQDIKSLLNVPITVSRRLIGIFGLESIREEVDWSEDMIVMATIVGQVFGNAIIRKQAEEERRHLEAQVRHAQKLESLGVLAGGIAHDFNNILMGIIGNAGLAMMELPVNSPVCECIWHIEKASQQAAELTNQLLAYSGKGAFSLRPVNLSELTNDMMHLFETVITKRAFLTTRLASDLPSIEGDPGQLRQVIMNLVTNASDAVEPNGGNIRIATGVMHADRAYLAGTYLHEDLAEGRYSFLEVSDTGTGMDSKTIGRMFDPFFSTKFTGRGLGLAAVLGIVRAHRGAIKVDSALGQGTVFRVIIPCSQRLVEKSRELSPPDAAGLKGGTVLVVDDEPAVRRVARLTLERSGYRVLTADDGQEALHVYRKHEEEIDCVLLDVTMPVMDGIETYYAIRKMDRSLPIVLSSGYSETDARERISEGGPVTFIQKPYTTAALVELVSRMIRGEVPH